MLLTVNACIEDQGFYVAEETIPEVVTNTGFSSIIEGFSVVQVISDFFQDNDILTIMTYGSPSAFPGK